MPRLEVSKPFGVWSHQLLMNVNIDTRVFNLHVYLSAVCFTFQGRTRGINFQPGVRPNSGRSRSIFMALSPSCSSSGCLSPHFLPQAEDFIVLFTTLSFYACFS